MDFTSDTTDRTGEIAALVENTFTASDGPGEGALIGSLARAMLSEVAAGDLEAALAVEDGAVIGAVLFTRLVYPAEARTAFILSPAAVAPARQGAGIGQRLIRYGLDRLRGRGVDIVLTYGDPLFYGRVGFRPVPVEEVPAPLPLSYPHGWLGQSLTEAPLGRLAGPCHCVAPLDHPDYW